MSLFSTWNYLVPAAGTTSAYSLSNIQAPATPISIDFSQVAAINGLPFNPSGVVIDNTNGSQAVVIVISPTGWTITCPIGKQMGIQFPAPSGFTAAVTANGANIAFVDYPVIPYLF